MYPIKTNCVRRFYWYILIVVIAFTTSQCANSISSPQGGPKDVRPPEVIETIPKNGSPNFKGNKFTVRFDEFVKLDNVEQSALISPPMKKAPDYRVKGKAVQVKFNEELKPNTTYSVYFGDAIVDITENNPISNYTYIFSTGEYVDSLSLYGNVKNAFNLTPVEGAFVMLYKDNNDTIAFDSLPYKVVPYYLSKTNVEGKFQFTGLSNDDFLLFSLLDQNSNFIFDQPGEQIAFLDSLIHPSFISMPVKDSITADSIVNIEIESDSILIIKDSIAKSIEDKIIEKNSVDLFMFLSPDTIQRILKAEVLAKNNIRFSFSQSAKNVNFEILSYPLNDSLFIEEYSIYEDTLIWHLNNPPIDSLELLLTQYNDTLGTIYLKLDPEKKSARLRKKDKEDEKKEFLSWTSNVTANKLDINKHLEIIFSQPRVNFNDIDSSFLIAGTDTIWNPEFYFSDSLNMKIDFPFDLLEETKYQVYFPDSAFTSWNNIHTEAIDIKFSTLPLKDYGILTFNLQPNKKQNYIFQLMNDKEKEIKKVLFYNDTTITFEYLKPANYLFKIIYDNNNNGVWNPGNYGLKIQPEEVIYYPKEVKVRANWEIEEDWKY